MILEGIVTTTNADGSTNISPMGPLVDAEMRHFVLRPYQTSKTYQNLKRTGEGVLHVTDDVELLARAAVGDVDPPPEMHAATSLRGRVITDACRWYEFQVDQLDDAEPRTEIRCHVVDQGRIRDFFGFNRAKHAVVEAAILATRCEFLPARQILAEFDKLEVIVHKTAGAQERRAFEFLKGFITERLENKTF